MAEEFNYNIQLAQAQIGATKAKEQEIEDRKDQRIKLQGTQQSELITKDKQKDYLKTLNHQEMMFRRVWIRSSLVLVKLNNYLIILYYVRSKTRRGF